MSIDSVAHTTWTSNANIKKSSNVRFQCKGCMISV